MESLTGKILIAMPGMGDPRFEQSVVLLCEHSDSGAMGIIVNKPADDVDFAELLESLEIESNTDVTMPVHFGGPVELGRGFVLHSKDYEAQDATMRVPPSFAMTVTLDILKDIAEKNGPDQAILALGYAGWGPGQLENEIKNNGWLISDATPEIIFAGNNDGKWAAALGTIGVDPATLSPSAGHA